MKRVLLLLVGVPVGLVILVAALLWSRQNPIEVAIVNPAIEPIFPEMVDIPAGPFQRGNPKGTEFEKPWGWAPPSCSLRWSSRCSAFPVQAAVRRTARRHLWRGRQPGPDGLRLEAHGERPHRRRLRDDLPDGDHHEDSASPGDAGDQGRRMSVKPEVSANEALQRLIEGNERFLEGKARFPTVQNDVLANLAKAQHPFATVIGCSDSRVPPELLFDANFGELFVIRVAGNVISPEVAGSLQFAGVHLKTPLFVVLGHTNCGAIQAALAMKFQEDPGGGVRARTGAGTQHQRVAQLPRHVRRRRCGGHGTVDRAALRGAWRDGL